MVTFRSRLIAFSCIAVTTAVALCLGFAWLSERLGLSLALGAFLAGLLLADSDYAHQALADHPCKQGEPRHQGVAVGRATSTANNHRPSPVCLSSRNAKPRKDNCWPAGR